MNLNSKSIILFGRLLLGHKAKWLWHCLSGISPGISFIFDELNPDEINALGLLEIKLLTVELSIVSPRNSKNSDKGFKR